ncbi:MAG: L-lactate dehydrogenase [Parvularculaceae bacterium]
MTTLDLIPASTEDYRRLAERRLPRVLFDYIDGGAYNEATLRANVADFAALKVAQRVMRDVSALDTSVDLFGERWTMPMGLAPIGMAGMMSRRAEARAVEVAQEFGVPFCLSTMSVCSLEEVAKAAKRPFWFQLYMIRDRGAVENLLQRARSAGVDTLVFTVDLAVLGARYRDIRNGRSARAGLWAKLRGGAISYALHPQWAYDVAVKGKPFTFGNLTEYVPNATAPSDFSQWAEQQMDASVTWKDIEWLRSIWPGKLIIKGVLSPDDAHSAARCGADGVVVSNHGGRQLDGVSSTIAMLPRIVGAAGDKTAVLIDGGVRSGLDVMRAVALGAKAALIGRAWIWAMAAQGPAGLKALLATMHGEIKVAMALTGARRIGDIDASAIDRG